MADEKSNVIDIDPRITFQIAKLALAEGDVLIVRSTVPRDPSVMYAASKSFSQIVPKGVRVMMIPDDVELIKLTKEQVDKLAVDGKG